MTVGSIANSLRCGVLVCAVITWAVFWSGPALAQSSSPQTQIKETVDQILATLSDKTMDNAARRNKISTLIRDRFDFRTMSQMTLATNWKSATEAQRARFIELFSQLLEETYMSRIEAYTDEKIHFIAEKIKGDKAMVDTRITTKTVEIPIDYKLVQQNDKWLVYDVVIEEVSLVRSYRSNYADVAQKEGIDGLLSKMQEKLHEIRSTPPASKTS